jgi:tetratricopeptide (TPR) repeat protein
MSSDFPKFTQAIYLANHGDLASAARLFREVWDMDRTNQATFYGYIRCLHIAKLDDQVVDAIDLMRRNLSSPLNVQILRIGLTAASRCGKDKAYQEILQELHNTCPSDPEVCVQLSALRIRQHQLNEAELILKGGLSKFPADPGLLTNLAILLTEKGDYNRAADCYNTVVKVAPRQFLGHYNLAMFLILLGRHAEARGLLNTCLEIVPSAPEALAAMRLIDERDQRSGGLAQFYQCIDAHDWEGAKQSLLAVKSEISEFKYLAAASELRPIDCDSLSLGTFFDFSRVVFTAQILRSEEPLVNELVCCLESNPSLVLNRAGKPTVSGLQTHEVLAECIDPAMIELKRRILEVCDEYLRNHAFNPWLKQLSNRVPRNISGWGVILRDRGHQKRHVHPEGVISGVVYLKTPLLTSSAATSEGNLVFSLRENCEIIPEVGKVVIFPSYLAHETVEIRGDEERICIAFNVS